MSSFEDYLRGQSTAAERNDPAYEAFQERFGDVEPANTRAKGVFVKVDSGVPVQRETRGKRQGSSWRTTVVAFAAGVALGAGLHARLDTDPGKSEQGQQIEHRTYHPSSLPEGCEPRATNTKVIPVGGILSKDLSIDGLLGKRGKAEQASELEIVREDATEHIAEDGRLANWTVSVGVADEQHNPVKTSDALTELLSRELGLPQDPSEYSKTYEGLKNTATIWILNVDPNDLICKS